MDTMSYSQMMLMVDLISKWDFLAYGIVVELIGGGLDWILKKDSHMGMQIMIHRYFAHIKYLSGVGWFLMVLM